MLFWLVQVLFSLLDLLVCVKALRLVEGTKYQSKLAVEGRLKYMSLSPEEHLDLFTTFMSDYGKVYTDEDEERARLEIFISNLAMIDQRNEDELEAEGTAVHGITQFADLTPEEFQSLYLGALHVPEKAISTRRSAVPSVHMAVATQGGTRVAQNWTGIYTTPVKDQGI
jgi:Cathepsin propeptide inhibitor domain (I29)